MYNVESTWISNCTPSPPLSHFSVATIHIYTLKILTEAAASVCLMVSNYGTVMNVDLRKQQQVICVHLVTV